MIERQNSTTGWKVSEPLRKENLNKILDQPNRVAKLRYAACSKMFKKYYMIERQNSTTGWKVSEPLRKENLNKILDQPNRVAKLR
jgi:hypothetical protein